MNKLSIAILLVAVALAAGEAPFRRTFRGRNTFQRQEAAPADPEYGAPPAPEYGAPAEGGAEAPEQQGYQYPTPEKPFEDGDNAEAPETAPQNAGYLPPDQGTEPQAERFRVQSGRSGRLQKLRQNAVPVLTFVPAADYYRLF